MKISIILAAGKGTRMQSELPKVAHKLCGREMINRVLDSTKEALVDKDIVVVGYKKEIVEETIDREVLFAYQEEQLGTGHAVMMATEYIDDDDRVIIICGDSPLIKSNTIKNLFKYNEDTNSDITITSFILDDPSSYGRIIKDENGNVERIVEFKECNDEQKLIKEINVGMYIVKGKVLKDSLKKISNNNAQNEYYLTDIVKIANEDGKKVNAYILEDFDEGRGVNSQEDLKKAEEIFLSRK